MCIRDSLTNRTFSVKYNDSRSTYYSVELGFPQGSVLGPLIFLIYTVDLPETNATTIASFADDVVVLQQKSSSYSDNHQAHLSLLCDWYKKSTNKIYSANKNPRNEIDAGHNPVSYTHLDVYKRQVVRDYLFDYKLLIVIIRADYE